MTDLGGTRWRVEDLAGQGLTGTASIEIAFGADGVLSGSTGVNRFRGPYRLVDDRMTIGPVTTTRMAGPPEDMAHENALLEIFARECTVRMEGADLLIDDGRSVTRLTSAESQDADAPPLVVRGAALYSWRSTAPQSVRTRRCPFEPASRRTARCSGRRTSTTRCRWTVTANPSRF